jgi:hypothetical protein
VRGVVSQRRSLEHELLLSEWVIARSNCAGSATTSPVESKICCTRYRWASWVGFLRLSRVRATGGSSAVRGYGTRHKMGVRTRLRRFLAQFSHLRERFDAGRLHDTANRGRKPHEHSCEAESPTRDDRPSRRSSAWSHVVCLHCSFKPWKAVTPKHPVLALERICHTRRPVKL